MSLLPPSCNEHDSMLLLLMYTSSSTKMTKWLDCIICHASVVIDDIVIVVGCSQHWCQHGGILDPHMGEVCIHCACHCSCQCWNCRLDDGMWWLSLMMFATIPSPWAMSPIPVWEIADVRNVDAVARGGSRSNLTSMGGGMIMMTGGGVEMTSNDANATPKAQCWLSWQWRRFLPFFYPWFDRFWLGEVPALLLPMIW